MYRSSTTPNGANRDASYIYAVGLLYTKLQQGWWYVDGTDLGERRRIARPEPLPTIGWMLRSSTFYPCTLEDLYQRAATHGWKPVETLQDVSDHLGQNVQRVLLYNATDGRTWAAAQANDGDWCVALLGEDGQGR